ncbi:MULTISPECIES: hypothetical protein [unclassified Streptomyces]|uniref:hypothetical protein n=1 Tax=unclassified Streptomyces TaxID=2593676 RepID=UPI000DB9F758|nr:MULTISPECIES: hypothetical protein [unclassified Streptomyces]MYT68380.1 hypothetical protein [Streptomyces sp. SID8367]RAJ67255.1 hypothetical protein K377_08186 [Streptomyces sp. PsTaAH-137]
MNAAEKLISHARQGHFEETLPHLLEIARRPGGARGPVWEAAAASIQILQWLDRFAEAADLAGALIRDDGPAGGELCDQDMPFDEALLAAPDISREGLSERLAAVAAHVPAGRILRERLDWLGAQPAQRPLEELLPGHAPWGAAPPVEGFQHRSALVERDFDALTDSEQRVVWQSLATANDFPRAHELVATGGHTPAQYDQCCWMAGWYAVRGDVERGEAMLIAAHDRWHPYMKWDALPTDPVLQPTLRQVTTDRVREHYLTRPIGPEAKG